MNRITVLVAVAIAGLMGRPARAQTAGAGAVVGDWTHGSTVSATAGVASASPDTGGFAGGAFGWEVTPRVMVEGGGLWLDRGDANKAFNAALKVRAGIRRAGVSPFVEGGFGLYRMSSTSPESLPEFYRNRLPQTGLPVESANFTDPSWHLGAGLNMFVSRHVAIQPAAEALIVQGGGSTYTLAVVSLRLAYHFEDHPVTPSRQHN